MLRGHSCAVERIIFSPNGSSLVSVDKDSMAHLRNWRTGAHIAALGQLVYSAMFSPDGLRLALASRYTLRLWDGSAGVCIAPLEGHADKVDLIGFSPDGSMLASGYRSHNATWLWDGRTGACNAIHEIHAIRFSPDGLRIASVSYDNTVQLWDGRMGARIAILKGQSRRVDYIEFSPDGSRLASASCEDTIILLWDGRAGTRIVTLENPRSYTRSIMFSPDSARLASVTHINTIQLWDGRTGARIAALERSPAPIVSFDFSPDSSRLAFIRARGTSQLWDASTGACIAMLDHRGGYFQSTAFSPDGSRLACMYSASEPSGVHNKTSVVQMFNEKTGIRIGTHGCHDSNITSIAFSPDGSRIASGFADATVRLWDGRSGIVEDHPDTVTF